MKRCVATPFSLTPLLPHLPLPTCSSLHMHTEMIPRLPLPPALCVAAVYGAGCHGLSYETPIPGYPSSRKMKSQYRSSQCLMMMTRTPISRRCCIARKPQPWPLLRRALRILHRCSQARKLMPMPLSSFLRLLLALRLCPWKAVPSRACKTPSPASAPSRSESSASTAPALIKVHLYLPTTSPPLPRR